MNGNQKHIKKLLTYLMTQLKDDITYMKRVIYKTSPLRLQTLMPNMFISLVYQNILLPNKLYFA